ncbi:cache domain-containing protein [Permianibacter sp. IMCC34836]|uniref:cache domain-containing protein n=1 Tax=Permianibacter fluminis TaxID=2738515 RepID=UPI001554C91B|nr:cache domain-containing protein [Permianibacter fluminis]NQD38969.1 cache domain-containing protein [Permianibacter fluminis]
MNHRLWHRLLGVGLLLVMIASGWGVQQLHQYWQQQALLQSSQQNEQLALHMETLLDGLQNHVKRMQHSAHLALHSGDDSPALLKFLQPALPAGAGGYSLDVLQQTTPTAQLGNVYAAVAPTTPAMQAELRIIWALFPLAAATHLTDSSLQWSYYNSLQSPLVGMFPYRSTERLLRDNDIATLPAMFEQFMSPEVQQRIAADIADQQTPVWRAPHIDKAGAGWVVPLVAPVRNEGKVIGAVSADVRLPFLSGHLARLTTAPERTLLIDDEQRVLADSRLSLETSNRLARLGERLPASLAALTPQLTRAHPGWTSAGDYHLMLRPLAHSQWTLVRVIPSDELLFDVRLRALAVALPLLVIALIAAVAWWRRRFE